MVNEFPVVLLADKLPELAVAMLAVMAAYAVFTLVGFGSALMASGPLAWVMPVGKVVPMLALLDFAGASLRAWRARKAVVWAEFSRLFPGMLLGQLLGVLILSRLPPWLMAMVLGVFVISLGLKGLYAPAPRVGAAAGWALAHGLFGGVLGGLFGSGGFIYAAYLERRLESRSAFRATQAVLIALSTAWRIVLCAWVGLLDLPLLLTALAFVPAMALGVYLGHRIDLRMSKEQLFRLLNLLLLTSGLSLILRFAPW